MNKGMMMMMMVAVIGLATAVPTYRVGMRSFDNEHEALFQKFKNQFGKVYFDSHDESLRKSIFIDNLNKINQHNEEAAAGKHTYTMAMNEFGDLSWSEFHAKYTGFFGARGSYLRSQNIDSQLDKTTNSPSSVDWVSKGAVTGVKNQGQCGSCWSFSTTGSIEGAHQIATGNLVSLSEQQLMDCSTSEGNHSCEGGLMDYAFEFVIKNGGICSEESYPYEERDESCKKSCTSVVEISSYKDVEESQEALMAAVAKGPVSVAIEADQSAFQFYSDGVMSGTCGTQLDHGVLAVGYGEQQGQKYWKVKNSWGESWGLSGYILLERGKDQSGGQCGILMSASYPVV